MVVVSSNNDADHVELPSEEFGDDDLRLPFNVVVVVVVVLFEAVAVDRLKNNHHNELQ